MTTPTLEAERTGQLIAAAERHAEAYDGDDRECIKTDVINAFYAGSEWERRRTAAPVAEGVALPLDAEGLPPLPEPHIPAYAGEPAMFLAEQVRQAQREAVEADRRARVMTEVLNNPPYGEPDLYSRLHTSLTDQIEVAKAAGKAREWFDAARSLVDYLASQAGFIAAAPSPLPPKEEAND